MWVTKLLISQVKKRIFAPKRPNLAQNWHFWSILARPCRLIQCPVVGRLCHLPLGQEGVLSFNSQTFSSRTFLSKRFPGNESFCKVNSPSNNSCVWFGLLRSIGSFSDMIQGLALMRIGTKSLLGLSFKQVGLQFCSPLEVQIITTCLQVVKLDYSVTQHSPLCTNCLW